MKETCDKNCATCALDNRSYCAVQIALANQSLILQLAESVSSLSKSMAVTAAPLQPMSNKK
jgi:hypothetical protein